MNRIQINVQTGEQTIVDFTDQEIAEIQANALAQFVVIPSINAAQIRLQLNAMGLRDAVELAVSAGSQDLKDKWQYSPRFVVTDPDIQAMATALDVTSEQLDQLFIDASKL